MLLMGCAAQASGPIGMDICDADQVLVAEVRSVTGYYGSVDGVRTILSDVRLVPTHRVFGALPEELLLTYEGGVVGTHGLSSSIAPTMAEGQTWLLFLFDSPFWHTPSLLSYRRFQSDLVLPPEAAFKRLWDGGCGRRTGSDAPSSPPVAP